MYYIVRGYDINCGSAMKRIFFGLMPYDKIEKRRFYRVANGQSMRCIILRNDRTMSKYTICQYVTENSFWHTIREEQKNILMAHTQSTILSSSTANGKISRIKSRSGILTRITNKLTGKRRAIKSLFFF